MARTPDIAGALEAVVTRTLKGTLGPRFRKLETLLRRLERKIKKAVSRKSAGRRKAAGRGRGKKGPGRPRGPRTKGRRATRRRVTARRTKRS